MCQTSEYGRVLIMQVFTAFWIKRICLDIVLTTSSILNMSNSECGRVLNMQALHRVHNMAECI